MGVFSLPEYVQEAYPFRYRGRLHVPTIAGGAPSDPKVAEGHIRSKVDPSKDDLIREQVAETMVERGVNVDEAIEAVGDLRSLNGFKRDAELGLYIEGRQLKACLREAAMIAANEGKIPSGAKWGKTNKGLQSWFVEHVYVEEERLYLGKTEADDIGQHFVTNKRVGLRAIQYYELCRDVDIDFTFISDHDWTEQHLAMIWLTAEIGGLGAGRSHGYGRFEVTKWEQDKGE